MGALRHIKQCLKVAFTEFYGNSQQVTEFSRFWAALPATKFLCDYLCCFKITRRHFLAK